MSLSFLAKTRKVELLKLLHSHWQVLKFSKLLKYSKLCNKVIGSLFVEKNSRKTLKSWDDHTKYH